jgi:O-acetyl-ADP-ribose deacetylase (regulator of RNase III)
LRTLQNVCLALVALTMAACSGLSAREHALLPAMRLAWQGVSADVSRGVEESALASRIEPNAAVAQREAVGKMTSALASGSPVAVAAVSWAPLAESAEFGLQRRVALGEISTGVAGSLRERVRNFGDSLSKFLERR